MFVLPLMGGPRGVGFAHGQSGELTGLRTLLPQLLGFYSAPRVIQPAFQAQPRRSTRRTGGGTIFNRERFVNAQTRVVLNPTGGESLYEHPPIA